MTTTPRYPNVTVKLIGNDGNAFAIIANMRRGLRAAKVPEIELKQFLDIAMSGDYQHLLQTCIEWVNVV